MTKPRRWALLTGAAIAVSALLAAVPVPDPVLQRQRRTERLATLAAVTS